MRALRFLMGLLLLPVCAAATWTAVALVVSVQPESVATVPPSAWAWAGGLLLWLVIYAAMPSPVRTYVLAHELTHALWGTLMGARVISMRVGKEGGSVTLSKHNFFVTLAPYFFPLYTVLAIGAYYVLSVFFDVRPYHLLWLGLVGFTWGFHLTFTIGMLAQHQPDVQEYGRVFSLAVIYLLNVLGMCLWVVMVTPVTLGQAAAALHVRLLAVGAVLWRISRQGVEVVARAYSSPVAQ
jgi:hypothetical protein